MAVLSLASGPNQEHDKLSGDTQSGLVAVVLLNESEREIDSRGDSR